LERFHIFGIMKTNTAKPQQTLIPVCYRLFVAGIAKPGQRRRT
jgi:hypothetical protein